MYKKCYICSINHCCNINFFDMCEINREISIQGEGALPLAQLLISFLLSCFKTHLLFFLFQQLSLNLIDSCTSGSALSPCVEISLLMNVSNFLKCIGKTDLFSNLELCGSNLFKFKKNIWMMGSSMFQVEHYYYWWHLYPLMPIFSLAKTFCFRYCNIW